MLRTPRACIPAALFAIILAPAFVHAAVINVTTADDYRKIEAAGPGDEVIVASGTYRFRLHLTALGSILKPIKIRAQDPSRPPVWDFSAAPVENAPGSSTSGDRGRAGWQIDGGAGYEISGITITGAHTSADNSAAIRYYNGAKSLLIRNCLFRQNDNGVTGGSEESEATVEFCEFDGNGNTAASSPTHNMYIYGGQFTLRYCYVHDSLQAQNFHIRAREARLEYNWFARAASYEGDLMVDDDFSGVGPFSQRLLLRGNIFVQNSAPGNHSQIVTLYNDTRLANESFAVVAVNNTLIANHVAGGGGNAAFIHLSNADGTSMSAAVYNNVIYGTTLPLLVENSFAAAVTGSNNWLELGTNPGSLQASKFGSGPPFTSLAGRDYTLAPGVSAIGGAALLASSLTPVREYFQNEAATGKFRLRLSGRDIGAFESTTISPSVGPNDHQPVPVLSPSFAGETMTVAWPITAPEFGLEQTTVLGSGVWTPAAEAVTEDDANFNLNAPLSPSLFFRLRAP